MSKHWNTPEQEHTTAVQGLFVQYQPAIRSYLLSMIPDFSQVDDVMQETFITVTQKASSFELGTSFPAWVRTIARFKALEAIRARRFETLSEEVLDALGAESREFEPASDQRLIFLRDCLDQLTPQARRSIDYRYRNDHQPPQIAKLMGCKVESVNVTLSRTRAFLRECVARRIAINPS